MNQSFGILNWGPLSLVRRNHGLEHATLNLLAGIIPNHSFSGHSDQKGFWVIGDVSTDVLLQTAQTALKRMKEGESRLAIHENCGTNYLTAGIIGGGMGWLATLGTANNFKKKLNRLPLMILIVTTALIAAQPLGPKVQERFTASGTPGNLVIKQIVRYERKGPALHRILTADSSEVKGG